MQFHASNQAAGEGEAVLRRDRELWESWRAGDPAAGSELLSLYEGAICGTIRRLGVRHQEEIADVYSELVITLMNYVKANGLEHSFFGLVRRMLVSLTLKHRARSKREARERVGDALLGELPAARSGEAIDFFEALDRCMTSCLASLESAVFQDRFLLGLDNG